MKTIEELIDQENSFFDVMKEWISESKNQVTLLSPSVDCAQVLMDVQVTTRSILGTLIYHTGGVLIDYGWVRVLGSGNEVFPRNVVSWNKNSNVNGLYLIADDVAGGFYAINGGAFPGEVNTIYYWPPDSMEWESLDLKFSDFFGWLLSGDLDTFYEGLRWEGWKKDLENISTDQCVSFYPFLWTDQGGCNTSRRGVVPISEALSLKYDLLSKIQ
ncbi:DUF2625 family protein [Marinobacter daepoensis]|uniref:DUF2625 family protein n=1 Tax=Marinobacter daepoensis TaxID=262077 RepID=UPI0004A2F409|nr:DUF2625 family protein [Marinobacter daepoensis]